MSKDKDKKGCSETATDTDGTLVPCAFEAGHEARGTDHRFIRFTGVVNRCGFCGETFEIADDDPHWSTGRGPLCPNTKPAAAPIALPPAELLPTPQDHVIKHFARCKTHNTIRVYDDAPCWKCWQERKRS